MREQQWNGVRRRVAELDAGPSSDKVFGSLWHRWVLEDPLADDELAELGRLFRILPVKPASSGAVARKAEGRPCTGCTRVSRQRGEVRYRATRVRQDPEETAWRRSWV